MIYLLYRELLITLYASIGIIGIYYHMMLYDFMTISKEPLLL